MAIHYPCRHVWFLFLYLSLVSSQSCKDLVTCSECLRSVLGCTWCITNTTAQCASDSLLKELNCSLAVNPHSRLVDAGYQTLGGLNQISLDSVTLRLWVGEPLSFNFTVKASDNYPLDLYILMDISNTFSDDLVQVKKLGHSLAESLKNLTNDSLIGFGTFADKQSPPFVSRKQLDLLFEDLSGDPSCRWNEECSLPVAYEHISNLTNSSDSFNDAIQQIIISTSADGPEGTLDAMMQAAVCTKLIGWRKKSRKVMLVMTDDEVHIAGDGRMGGITKRNDEQCHTEYNEEHDKFLYSTSTEQDYPSFEQLRLVLRRNGIVPIFAIPMTYKLADIESNFAIIKDLLNGFLAVSSDNSANLIYIIADTYDDIISQVLLDFKSPNFLQTFVQYTCPPFYNISTERCTNINGEEVQVNMTLTLTECVTDANGDGYPLEVTVPGFDKFTIIIKGECSCDCDNMTQTNVTKCINGELKCGKCYCNTGWKEDNCNCSSMACPSFNGQVCGGRGTCDGCGNCVCNTIDRPIGGVAQPVIFGDACQCSNYECELDSNDRVCSSHGDCVCDTSDVVYSCNCIEPYYGDMCQCSTYYCINPEYINDGVCSRHGSCNTPCQRQGRGCKCDDNYIGDYCQTLRIESIRDDCGSGNDDCIECYGKAAEENKEATCVSCEGYSALYTVQLSNYEIPGTIDGSTQECSLSTAECNYVYFIGSGLNGTGLVYAVEPRSCLLLPIWNIVIIVVMGLLIAIVLVLIVIKAVIMWLDHLDYKSFMSKVMQSSSSVGTVTQNPIYESLDEIMYVSSSFKD